MRNLGSVLLLSILLSACGAPPSAAPTGTSAPTTRPSIAPATPAPTAATSLSGAVASSIDPTLELRVWIAGDVGGPSRTPTMSLYRDGTILRGTEAGPRLTKVTAEAVALLKDSALASGLFTESGSIPVDPEYAGGFTSYSVQVRTGQGTVWRGTTNAVAEKDRAVADSLIRLSERLADPETLIPADGWVVPPAQAVPYVAADYVLEVLTQPYGGDPDDPNAPRDVAEVAWPLEGKLVEWGVAYEQGPTPDGEHRCGTVSLADAARVEAALDGSWSSERLPASDWMMTSLLWRESSTSVDVMLFSLLPDDLVACPPDPNAPQPEPSDGLPPTPYELSFAPTTALVVSVAELNLRTAPSTQAPKVALLERDDVLVVYDHPFVDGDYRWYYGYLALKGGKALPALPDGPPPAIDPAEGWVALSFRSDHYLRALPPRCPSPVHLDAVGSMTGSELLDCFVDRSIELEGSMRCFECGGVGWVGEPAWLARSFVDPVLYGPGGWVSLYFPPSVDDRDATGNIVSVRGHFDDPSSADCRIEYEEGKVLATEIAIQHCRTRFVVEDLTVLRPDPDWQGV